MSGEDGGESLTPLAGETNIASFAKFRIKSLSLVELLLLWSPEPGEPSESQNPGTRAGLSNLPKPPLAQGGD